MTKQTVPYYKNKASVPTGSILSSQTKDGGKIYYVRHGSTHLNSADKLRSWQDIPLDDKGKKEAEKVGEELKDKKINKILCSDLSRSEETAHIVSDKIGVNHVEASKGLRPWNLGNLAGKDVEETLPILKDYAENKPNSSIKDGESFNTFKKRYIQEVKKIIADHKGENVVIVSHHRGDRLLDAWEKEGDNPQMQVDLKTFFQKGMEPGTYRVIDMDKLTK